MLYFASTDPGVVRASRLFSEADGAFQPKWFDRRDADIWFRAGPTGPTSPSMEVEWGTGGPTTHLDRVTPMTARAGSAIVIEGTLGVRSTPREVELVVGTRREPLAIQSWTCGSAILRVPASVPPGTYQLVVTSDAMGGSRSNFVSVTITP